MPRWRRAILVAIGLLVCGAVINVIVAWGCAGLLTRTTLPEVRFTSAIGFVQFDKRNEPSKTLAQIVLSERRGAVRIKAGYTPDSPYSHPIITSKDCGFLPRWGRRALLHESEIVAPTICKIVDARGWPMVALQSQVIIHPWLPVDETRPPPNLQFKNCIALPTSADASAILDYVSPGLPLGIVWPAFIFNTLFYAIALFAVVSLFALMNRRFPALARIAVCLSFGALLTIGVSWWCGWKVLYGLDAYRDRAHRRTRNAVIDPDIYHVNGAAVYVVGVLRTTGAAQVTFRALRPDLAEGLDQSDPQQFDSLWRTWGPTPASWGPQRWLGYGATEQVLLERPSSSDMHFEARGWPMLATWCEFHGSVQGGFHLGLGHIPGTFATTDRVLPYRIIWFGFVANTMFYACIVCAIAFGPGALRRRWRIRHHRCTTCGYPIGESERCSECGAAVVRHRSALQAAGA